VLIWTREQQFAGTEAGGLTRIHVNDDQRDSASSRGFYDAIEVDLQIETKQREVRTQDVVQRSTSRSHRCGVRHPATADWLKSYIVKDGATSPSWAMIGEAS
jgi:hypothetical protein